MTLRKGSSAAGACNGGPEGMATVGKMRWVPMQQPGEIRTHWWWLT